MLDTIFDPIFISGSAADITAAEFLLCLAVSLAVGAALALFYRAGGDASRSFLITLALLPACVCVVIMLVNGNIGAGVAVAGAFGLVRFRSAPGTAKEICGIFLAMAAGLAAGMGYLGYSALFTLILGGVSLLYARLCVRAARKDTRRKLLKVTVPEDLDYDGAFDDLFARYTARHELVGVKTVNMGSLFRLTYTVTLKDQTAEKQLIDALRCRNGNLEISSRKQEELMEL